MEFDPSHNNVSLGEVIGTHEGKMLLAYSSQIEAKGSCAALHCKHNKLLLWDVVQLLLWIYSLQNPNIRLEI